MVSPEPVGHFVDRVRELLGRPDYLLPIAAAQRQFRSDNYQMGSASLLEDLFFDALGTFVLENEPNQRFSRREGREPWDYEFFGLKLSHKENNTPGFTAYWEPGNPGPNGAGRVPKAPTYDFPHPVVLVFSGVKGDLSWTSPDLPPGPNGKPRTGQLQLLGAQLVASREPWHGRLLVASHDGNRLTVTHVWSEDEREDLNFLDLWPEMGGRDLLSRDIWIDRSYKGERGLLDHSGGRLPQEVRLDLAGEPLLPGVYVITSEQLRAAPLEANNKAHYVTTAFAESVMEQARTEGRFVPMPLWFAAFADTTPPNLYSVQRRQYEALFAARRRVDLHT